ncbi:hypothetical protein TraAM80_00475 [Trypanosoma rangeli]|uniref:Uncharacterized protein n=1 Tax=Trypanosoma rangeli TaxID=5698 RepID=A0A422P3F0_TRYRA|nr:uncharacterized protein TraAM80_00475 [Trypanosoma rangeli]RNF12194.1 hypothetical protein TraAM80_00475 [Trypanosoma rangeli]|eukprot:RNF12194.1 hypothetical protein TraAM80_00475 [Trypanosoma rangeli]
MGMAVCWPMQCFRGTAHAKVCSPNSRSKAGKRRLLKKERDQHHLAVPSESLAFSECKEQRNTSLSGDDKGQKDQSAQIPSSFLNAVGIEGEDVGSETGATENKLGAASKEKQVQQVTMEDSAGGVGDHSKRQKLRGKRKSVSTSNTTSPLFPSASFRKKHESIHGGTMWDGTQRFKMSSRTGGDSTPRLLRVASGRKSPNSTVLELHSHVGSVAELSLGSNTRSTQSALGSAETTRKLINAKAVLRKHLHQSLVSSSESIRTSSCRSAVHTTRAEGDVMAARIPVNPLVQSDFYGENALTTQANWGEFGDWMVEEESECSRGDNAKHRKDNTFLHSEVSSSTLSSLSVSRIYRSSLRPREHLPADRLMICDLMDFSVEYATSDDPPDHLSCRLNGRATVHAPQNTGFPSFTDLISLGHASQINGAYPFESGLVGADSAIVYEEHKLYESEPEQDTACNTNTNAGWVGIGGEDGVGDEDWYARLRARLHVDEAEAKSGTPSGTGGSCGDDEGEKEKDMSPVVARECKTPP